MANKINLIDTTLREGLQAPGVILTLQQTLELAQTITKTGVDMLEIGHPAISSQCLENITAVCQKVDIPCLVHARANKSDILAASKSSASWVGIFVGINKDSLNYRLNQEKPVVLNMIKHSIGYAKDLGLNVRFTLEDASCTKLNDILATFNIAIEAGVDRICFADTRGVLEPSQVSEVISKLKSALNFKNIEVHFHNDRGLALANSLAAISSGATWVSCSINGIGERSGITDTLTLMANLNFRGDRSYDHKLKKFIKCSKLVQAYTRIFLPSQYPITGEYAFTHTAKLHINALTKNDTLYTWEKAEKYGRNNILKKNTLPNEIKKFVNIPKIISAEELKYHRKGPGQRFVMIDERFISDCRQYCIVRTIEKITLDNPPPPHVDTHTHHCDSLFLFLGKKDNLSGLSVIVIIDGEEISVNSPASIFIPAGRSHCYKIISGSGLFINYVLSGSYNDSLLD